MMKNEMKSLERSLEENSSPENAAGSRRGFLMRMGAVAVAPSAIIGASSSANAQDRRRRFGGGGGGGGGFGGGGFGGGGFFGGFRNNGGAIVRRDELKEPFRQIQEHENDHVAGLQAALGSDARPKPTFQNLDQMTYEDFLMLTRTFENTGVGAYLGAAPFINDPLLLGVAGSIATVEARHSGFINFALGEPLTQNNESFETALTAEQVRQGVSPFIADLNGGPPVDYAQNRSDRNDVRILNFALALEFLEAEFYNINFPTYFGSR